MKAPIIQSIKLISILIISISLINCKQNKLNKEDAISIMEIMDDYTLDNYNPSFVVDNISQTIIDKSNSELSINIAKNLGLDISFDVDDLGYVKEQIRNNKNSVWSKSNIHIEGDLIEVSNSLRGNEIYSKLFWADLKSKFGDVNKIKVYSFPVFNLNHDISFVTYAEFFKNASLNSGFITCKFRKYANGKWKRESCINVN